MPLTTIYATPIQSIVTKYTVDHEQTIVGFVSIQFFFLIYFQRIALAPNSFPVSIPLIAMLCGIGWMVISQTLTFQPKRVALYLLFVGCCLWSHAFVGGSLPSLLQLLVLYGVLTVSITISNIAYRKIMNRFIMFMILPASIMVFQFSYQKLTGLPNPISMNQLIPQSMLMQGYFYEAHYPWYSHFTRSNGFFFLEPSYASMFSATALIIEITYFRRAYLIILMLTATIMSIGGTGISMLIIAAPFLLLREKLPTIILTVSGVLMGLIVAYSLNMPLPLIDRSEELNHDASSGGQRLLLPALRLGELLADSRFIFVGDGAGSVIQHIEIAKNGAPKTGYGSRAVMNPWPMVKVYSEYGLMAMLAYTALFFTAIAGNFNLSLKVALSFTFLLTGAYLVNPPLLGLLTMLFFVIVPQKGAEVNGEAARSDS